MSPRRKQSAAVACHALTRCPDICLVRPGGAAVHLELKSPKGRQTPEHAAFEQLCKANGSPYAVARTIDEAIAALTAWGCLRSRRQTQMTNQAIDSPESR